MSFGSTPDTWLYELFFGLGALAAIGLVALIGGLVRHILRIKVDYFTLLFTIIVGVGVALGLSLYLDSAGQVVEASVTKKENLNGSNNSCSRWACWLHSYCLPVGPVTAGSALSASGVNDFQHHPPTLPR